MKFNKLNVSVLIYINSSPDLVTTRWVYTSLLVSLKKKFDDVVLINRRDKKCDVAFSFDYFIAKQNRTRIFFSLINDSAIDQNLMKIIKYPAILKLNYITDPDLNFSKTKVINKHCDFVCIPFLKSVNLYLQAGFNAVYFPYCAQFPHLLNKNLSSKYSEKIKEINFIGSPTGARLRMLNLLNANMIPVKSNINLNKICPKLKYKAKPEIIARSSISIILIKFLIRFSNLIDKLIVKNYDLKRFSDEEYLEIMGRSQFQLSILEHANTDLMPYSYSHIRMRDLEALMCSSILITKRTPDTEYLHSQGIKIYFYDSEINIIDIINRLFNEDCNTLKKVVDKNIEIMKLNFDWGNRLLDILGNRLTNFPKDIMV